jgi:DNA/RNA-binding domain of Phe-tRNA-synthetase-like protein
MKLVIENEIIKKYPMLRIGIVTAKDITPKVDIVIDLEQLKRKAEENLRASGWRTDTISQHPYISAWRATYQSFGVKAKRHNPTAEAMIRRILNGDEIPKINAIVDIYLSVEVAKWLPIGGYDSNQIDGDITLRFSHGGESFKPIGGGQEFTDSGEVVYSDKNKILTRRWNYRDCDLSKITADSTDVILMSEAALEEIPTDSLEETIQLLSKTIGQFFDGDISNSILDVKLNNNMEIINNNI